MKSHTYRKYITLFSAIIFVFIGSSFVLANNLTSIKFNSINALRGLPTNEVQKVYQDCEGFIWIATRNGLCMYDGYDIKLYKSDSNNPSLLTNNNITCLVSDTLSRLWIGTEEGLNILNKKTGKITPVYWGDNLFKSPVSDLLVVNNKVYVGSGDGLLIYDDELGQLSSDIGNNLSYLRNSSVKSLIQDSKGYLWIGTWDHGLFRYSFGYDEIYRYPQMNSQNSAHVVFEDSENHIWIGSWNDGLYRLINPYHMDQVAWVNYQYDSADSGSLMDNRIYAITEDSQNKTLWIGSRSGLSGLANNLDGVFVNYSQEDKDQYIPCDEVNSLFYDSFGNLWIGAIGGGVLKANMSKKQIQKIPIQMKNAALNTRSIRSVYLDSNDNLWVGLGSYDFAVKRRGDQKFTFFKDIPEFKNVYFSESVYVISEWSVDNSIWLGTYSGGIFKYKEGVGVTTLFSGREKYLKSNFIFSLHEDHQQNMWIGTRYGASVLTKEGKGYLIEELSGDISDLDVSYIRQIIEDKHNNLWFATVKNGIIKLTGDLKLLKNLKTSTYLSDVNGYRMHPIVDLYVDNKGYIWAGSEDGCLYLYDEKQDAFIEKKSSLNIQCKSITSIIGDDDSNLWLGTNEGLAYVNHPLEEDKSEVFYFTRDDGLLDDFLIPRVVFKKDEVFYFGSYKGLNVFQMKDIDFEKKETPFFITDFKVFNKSIMSLPINQREKISLEHPSYSKKIDIAHCNNNFSIEFAALTYTNPNLNKYAYQLEGFDKEWIYTDASRRSASYNNLPSGKYTFLLKASNESGVWSDTIQKVDIVVYPPFWLTWWAFLLYLAIIGLVVYYLYNQASSRLKLKNEIKLRELEKKKSDELNHAKLQFFTNITHELLTPLTVISATVDELSIEEPSYNSLYEVMKNNLQRLMRLLQQILEFRKAESGNLQLRVSYGDIALFVRNGANSFYPLIKKKDFEFSISTHPEMINGYFDVDKLDKILYNLLSNAAKYNIEGGKIEVSLKYKEEDDNYVILSVKDDGAGIPKEKQKELFKRFYDGDYRKYNTVGTGIGLSLVQDLVRLHKGEVWVESEEGRGAVFFVSLPISRSSFDLNQLEDRMYVMENLQEAKVTKQKEQSLTVSMQTNKHEYTLLVVEDNLDLLNLMVKLLSKEYNVFIAKNGKEALAVIEDKEVDLIVTDVMMPVMDGLEFCSKIKINIEYSHIPVLLLTAKNTEKDRIDAYDAGADGYISKPFNLTVLYSRIKNLLENRERRIKDFKDQLVFDVKDLDYTSVDEEFMNEAVACVNKHISNSDFDQTLFAEEMQTSKSTLYRKLKSLTGLSTPAFINNIRLKAACQVLEEKGTGIRISELAYTVGFNDPKYFSSCFKREFGITPTEYIERFSMNR